MPSCMTPRAEKGEKLPFQDSEEQLRRRLLGEERRRSQAEARAADLLMAKKAASNAHAQLQSQERKIEQLQKELEDTSIARKEAQRRNCDLEADRGRVKKALYEKEQQLLTLQKSLTLAKAQLEERGKRLEEITSDSEKARQEAAALRCRLEASPARQSPGAEDALRSLRERFTAQTMQTEGQLLELAKAQESLHQRIMESASQTASELAETKERLNFQGEELEKRRAQLFFALKESERQEAQLEATIAVRDASLAATASLCRRLERELDVEKMRSAELEGAVRLEQQEKHTLMKRAEEKEEGWRQERQRLVKDVETAASQHAQVCGRLCATEKALLLSRAQKEDLVAQLASCADQAEAQHAEQAADTERLRAELYDALAGRAEANQAVAAKDACIASLTQEVEELGACLEGLRHKSQEAERREQAASAKSAKLEEEVGRLKALASETESAKALAEQRNEELCKMRRDHEEQSRQNAELMESMQAHQKDVQQLTVEVGALREADARFEASWNSEMARHANAGHNNHRQKIQHIIDLKEGNHSLRTELKKARQRIAQLEVACAGEVAAKVAGGKRLSSTATTPPRVQQSLCRPARPGSRADVSAAEDMPIPQDKTLERLSLDFRHVLWLLERAAVNCAGSLSVPPLAESGPAAFLRRLGDLAMAERASAASARSPAGSTSQVPAPTTPDRRQSVLDGLSDLGSEAPDAASDMDLEEAK